MYDISERPLKLRVSGEQSSKAGPGRQKTRKAMHTCTCDGREGAGALRNTDPAATRPSKSVHPFRTAPENYLELA